MLSPELRALHEANRVSWNAATIAHNSHKGDQIRFFQNGGDTLFAEELSLLGDLDGRRVLHLQCNCGQDTLSLAKRGARVTGVDISDQAVDFARHLARRSDIDAEFYRADLYDWLREHGDSGARYDIVFSSYGFLQYLSTLKLWSTLIRDVLAPGGEIVLVEFHPVLSMFDRQGRLAFPYSARGRPQTIEAGVPDYVGIGGDALAVGDYHEGIRNFANPYPQHTFRWGIGEVTDALVEAGLSIDVLREYMHGNGHRHFQEAKVVAGRRVLPPPRLPEMPMMFGLRASG